MATIIDNKIYDLVTMPENFDFAWDITERFSSIKDKLWLDFFTDFQEQLKKNHPNCFYYNSSKWLFEMLPKNWKHFEFNFSLASNHFEIGIIIKYEKNKKAYVQIENVLKPYFAYLDESSEKNQRVYNMFDEDLTTLYGFKKILPQNRNELIQEYIGSFELIFNDLFEELNKFEIEN